MGFSLGALGGLVGLPFAGSTALGLAAGLGDSYLQYSGQQDANAQNAAIAADNRAFQERMSSTAYQRATADMRAAGINPLLAYQQGGASTPVGSVATMENSFAGVKPVSSALDAAGAAQQLSLVKAQIDNAKANNVLISEQAAKTMEEGKQAAIDTVIKRNTAQAVVDRAVAESSSAKSASAIKGNEIPKSQLYSDAWRGANAILDKAAVGGSSAWSRFSAPTDGKSWLDVQMNRFRNLLQ